MISWLHLLWIVPVSASFGLFIAALLSASGTGTGVEFPDKWDNKNG